MRKRICSLFLVVALLLTALVAVLPAAAEDSAEVAALKADPTKSWQEIAAQVMAEVVATLDKTTYDTEGKQYRRGMEIILMPEDAAANKTIGNAGNPALIKDGVDLAIISLYGDSFPSVRFKVNNDIDLAGHPWEMSVKNFTGTIWGNHKTIQNVTVNALPTADSGLFCARLNARQYASDGRIDNLTVNVSAGTKAAPLACTKWTGFICAAMYQTTYDKTVMNPNLENVTLNADVYIANANTYLGGMVGYCNGGHLTNCTVNGTIYYSPTASSTSLGGMVGRVNRTEMKNCVNNADISMIQPTLATAKLGGLVGFVEGDEAGQQNFTGCVNYGTLTVQATNIRVGGICGWTSSASGNKAAPVFNQCENYGRFIEITGCNLSTPRVGTGNTAGILGYDEYGTAAKAATFTNCFVVNQWIWGQKTTGRVNDGASTGNVALGLSALDLSTSAGAQIRLKEGSSGLRFNATLNKSAIESLLAQTGVTVSVGMLIAPTAHVTAAGKFTKEALDAYKAATPALAEIDIYRDVKVDKKADGTFWWFSEENGTCSFNAALANLYAENFDVAFSAIAYVTVTANGKTFTVYGNFDDDVNDVTRTIDGTAMTWYGGQSYNEANQSRTVRFVAQAAMNDRSETVEGKYVNNVAAAYPSANGAYSPYTEAQLAMVNAFLA